MRTYNHAIPYILTAIAGGIGTYMLIMTLYVLFSLDIANIKPDTYFGMLGFELPLQLLAKIGVAFWTLAPPIWFWFEYFYLFKRFGHPEMLESFKHGQHVSTSIWAGVIAFMLFVTNFNLIGTN